MKTIKAVNVNDALSLGIGMIHYFGEKVESRVGDTLEVPCPVATTYSKPWERVLINKERDANPFFHLMESLWILAGRDDVKFLTEFNSRMVDYSDDGKIFNAPYGYRLRNYHDYASTSLPFDQLESIISILKKDPNSHQAVAQIWDVNDIEKETKDKACNMSIVFRIRNNRLCMVVYNRSNDMIWGAYGANVVQFSMIQEYVAAHLGLSMGEYTQVTNSYHVYTTGAGGKVWDRLKDRNPVTNPYNMVNTMSRISDDGVKNFEHELKRFFNTYDKHGLKEIPRLRNWYPYFGQLVIPMLYVYNTYKSHGVQKAVEVCNYIHADDWRMACEDWLGNRSKK